MSKYVSVFDIADPALAITESHTQAADVFVDAQLWQHGINPADVVLPHALLTELATLWAKRQAATEGAIGENSPLIDKARAFERDAMRLAGTLTRQSLGIVTTDSFGSVQLGRG